MLEPKVTQRYQPEGGMLLCETKHEGLTQVRTVLNGNAGGTDRCGDGTDAAIRSEDPEGEGLPLEAHEHRVRQAPEYHDQDGGYHGERDTRSWWTKCHDYHAVPRGLHEDVIGGWACRVVSVLVLVPSYALPASGFHPNGSHRAQQELQDAKQVRGNVRRPSKSLRVPEKVGGEKGGKERKGYNSNA